MLTLAFEIKNKGYLLKIDDVDRLLPIPELVIEGLKSGDLPDEILVNGNLRKLHVAGHSSLEKINLKIGSRIALIRGYSEVAILIEMVRAVVTISGEVNHSFIGQSIYKCLTLSELMELI